MKFKKARKKKLLYPYLAGFDNDANFRIKFNDETDLNTLCGNNDSFDLEINISPDSKFYEEISNNIEVFRLESIYHIHKQQVREILFKQRYYSEAYIKMLNTLFSDCELSKAEMDLLIYGYTFEKDEELKKPLVKLVKDIIN